MIAGIEVIHGAITRQAVGALIRGAIAGESLEVPDDRILETGGGELCHALRTVGARQAGEAVITPGFHLSAPYVIHAFLPAWHGGSLGEDRVFAQAITAALQIAVRYRVATLAMPPMGQAFPIRRAAIITVGTLYQFLLRDERVYRVSIVCPDPTSYHIYDQAVLDLDE